MFISCYPTKCATTLWPPIVRGYNKEGVLKFCLKSITRGWGANKLTWVRFFHTNCSMVWLFVDGVGT